ncbi:MAG: carbon-nitrogen hydrolase family protein [Arenicellales bacterium]|jgi:predicted amidohydrolase
MSASSITRRQFNRLLASGLIAGSTGVVGRTVQAQQRLPGNRLPVQLKVAAIQMLPKLGDVLSNMNQAEHLILKAIQQGAEWIILPEMFTSAVAFHDSMLKAIQPLDGPPLQLLKKLASKNNVVIGGSFLAARSQQVFNTFVLVFPDGTVFQHDKDMPTYWENCYYQGGNDDGILSTPIGPVGSVLCWELIRSQTARRLFNRVNMVVSGSCWWTLPDDADPDSPRWSDNLKMLQNAPQKVARMLGVPVIHASHVGNFEGFFSPELPDVPYHSSYLGETMIVDADGTVIARIFDNRAEGVVTAEIKLVDKPTPTEAIPEAFWIPEEMPQDWKEAWTRWFERGADYFNLVTEPYLATGQINEYTPEYMR